jgi:glycosyltransferase involved in cell wall biosynthesis
VAKVSIIVPSRNEQFLVRTVEDLLANAKGDIEIIVVLEGYWEHKLPINDKRLVLVHHGEARGMRGAINSGVATARGEFLMKCDAHCAFDRGYDEVLKADCEKDWVVVPRQFNLDAEKWRPNRSAVDYWFLCYPNLDDASQHPSAGNDGDRGGRTLHGRRWEVKNKDPELKKTLIDDLMSAQGSCWFMRRDNFHKLGLLDEKNYGTFGNEFQEIGLKTWLSGGRVVCNKGTWYAHLHKGRKYGRGWPLGRHDADKAAEFTKRWVTDSAWDEKQILPFKWLIQRFWPVPGWPEEWGTGKVEVPPVVKAKDVGTFAKEPGSGRDRNYSSHMPVLFDLLHKTDGAVLEVGAGRYSTPLIHWACASKQRHVVTLESDPKFFEYAAQFADTWHKVVLVKDWDEYPLEPPNGKPWSLAFVDHLGPRRSAETKRLAPLAEIVVCHDTCGRDDRKYRYSEAWPLYKYRHQCQFVRPRTSVVSNTKDVRLMGLP